MLNRAIIAMTAALVAALSLQALPATAYISDSNTFAKLQGARQNLVVKESDLKRDYDGLARQIDALKRVDDGRFSSRINDLMRDLNSKSYDLRDVQLDIRDLDVQMI